MAGCQLHLANPGSVLVLEKMLSNRSLVELVNPDKKQRNNMCRRIMFFLSKINSE